MTEKSTFKKDKFLSQIFKKRIFILKNILKKKIPKNKYFFLFCRSKKKINNLKKYYKTVFVQKEILFEKSLSNNKNSHGYFQSDIIILSRKNQKFYSKKKKELIKKISSNSFTQSRFFKDKNINIKIAKKIKFLWVDNFFKGKRADYMFIKEINDKPIGFLLLKKFNKNFIIDLIAVEKKYRGKRIASELLRYCEYYLLKNSNSFKITALTQSLNFASYKLYKKNNYKIKNRSYVYHLYSKSNDIVNLKNRKIESKNKIVIFFNGQRGIEVLKFLKKKGIGVDLAVTSNKKILRIAKKKQFTVKKFAVVKNLKKNFALIKKFKKNKSIFISAGFSQIFTENFIAIPKYFLNLHAGSLPKYRGGSPLNWAIINNDLYCSVSIIQVKSDIDSGGIYVSKKIKIGFSDTIQDLHKKVNKIFGPLLYSLLIKILNNKKLSIKKQNLKPIYWHQRNDLDGYIDFNKKKALEVYNFVRALSKPYKGAWALTNDFKKVRILKTKLQKYKIRGNPGHILFLKNRGMNIVCKDYAIKVLSYRVEGKKINLKERIFI